MCEDYPRDYAALNPQRRREHEAIIPRLALRTTAAGTLSGPCIPALFEHYLDKALRLFELLDRPLTADQRLGFAQTFRRAIEQGFATSPYAQFVLEYGPAPNNPAEVGCQLSIGLMPLEEQYRRWLGSSGASPHPFGQQPDAKVLDVAARLPSTPRPRILDVGAGTGRNALALARTGRDVDAIEPVLALADQLEMAAANEGLLINVIREDVLAAGARLPVGGYQLLVLSEVATHFSFAQLAAVLPKLAGSLAPGGSLVMNAFVAEDDYQPDDVAKQAAPVLWSTFFSRAELASVAAAAGLAFVAEDPCVVYEQARQPPAAWPPTDWYVPWAKGHNLFDQAAGAAPIELHWLEYRKLPSPSP
jgi:SAM-dependent methyltransferase